MSRNRCDDEELDRLAQQQLKLAESALDTYYRLMCARDKHDTGPYYPDEGYAAGHLNWELKHVRQSHERRTSLDRDDYNLSEVVSDILDRSQEDKVLDRKRREAEKE